MSLDSIMLCCQVLLSQFAFDELGRTNLWGSSKCVVALDLARTVGRATVFTNGGVKRLS